MPIGDMKVMIPIDNVDDIGIREIIDANEAEKVFELLKEDRIAVNNNWNKRYRENMMKIKSGDIFEVAEVVKTLMLREKEKGLSTGEKKMLSNAKQILISELVLAKGVNQDEIENIIDSYVKL